MKLVLVSTLAAVAAIGLAGCVPLGSPGSLQSGAFAYVCAPGVTDLGCSPTLIDESDVPGAIAVGTHFDIQYNVAFASDVVIDALKPAAPSLLATEPASQAGAFGFRFSSAGTVAVLATTFDGQVADFLHVTAAPLDHLAITDFSGSPVTSVAVPSGGATISAEPFSASQSPLAGGMVYTWATSDATVVTVQPAEDLDGESAGGNQVTLVPGQAGTATVTASALGKQATVAVTVSGGAP
jgi:hypothetical protein